jgi:chromosomal replication initiator protein
MGGDQLQFGDDERSIALRRAWDRALAILSGKVNKATFESYIKPVRPLAFEQGEAVLGVASPFAREWLDKRYALLISSVLTSIYSVDVAVRFQVIAPADIEPVEWKVPAVLDTIGEAAGRGVDDAKTARSAARSNRSAGEGFCSLPLNSKYTFDNFIIGNSNRLAQASAEAVAGSPGAVYNPLFVYGPPGLGKTHLLHAIGHAASQSSSASRVAYIDGENFTYHYVTSLRERKTEEFRRYYRSVDVWLVDDIQFIAGAERTKEEFFHTFNALYQSGKQIVISSDRSPRELRTMDERLRSRFECGLVADIASPDLETRMAILQRRADAEDWHVSREVVYYIANAIRSNVRALEGALTKLVACSSVMKCPISIELAQNVLGDYLIERPGAGRMAKGMTFETILAAVADHFRIPVEVLVGERRDQSTALARQVAMLLCREMTGSALSHIGSAFGGRDHTTIQRGIAKVERLLKEDSQLTESLDSVRETLYR